ncbi:MAG TPA: isoprenylcysteine carboxylmethyltransferase family protein [Novosphingobium sp.]|nr:isoprenylcysteine carboxylmethyltransferase family protein [Novosphingobium sp.]
MTDATGTEDRLGARVFLPPPMVFIVMVLAGEGFARLVPFSFGANLLPVLRGAGLAAMALGLAVIAIAFLAFRRRRTALKPWKPTTAIVDTGIFALSRNPMYVAFALIAGGLGLVLDNGWILLGTLPALLVVRQTAVLKEEAYLQAKFGEEYLAYKARVRRWL